MFHAIHRCRVCGSTNLEPVVGLGTQALTGVFPRAAGAKITRVPLEVVRCAGDCGLVQLRHSYDPDELYGGDYGYRSSLNRSMVDHLRETVESLAARVPVGPGDVVLDIGSNDGTTLSFYPEAATLIGIDPTAAKFAKYYRPHITVVPEFFTAGAFLVASGGKKAKIITSIAMFYDLESPLDFMKHVHAVLAEGGVWHTEMSYLPSMLAATAYDTICHEHAEYYSLATIVWMADRVGFSIVDASLNDTNGGSFALAFSLAQPGETTHAPVVLQMLEAERLTGLSPFTRFADRVAAHKRDLRGLLEDLTSRGARVLGMGASTKGNVVLQYCGIGRDLLPCIAEVNQDKIGGVTPGTEIPIVSEEAALAMKPDVFLVLPWHFRESMIRRMGPALDEGVKLLFPLPTISFFP
jgi:NDP-4-keto-2,6-dideoxyhexose 3-C-methyltransferase